MQPDLEFLRRHYAALSDDALLEIDRAELVEAARPLYNHELVGRKLASKHLLEDERPEWTPGTASRPRWTTRVPYVFSIA
jgi:hypothetical protein